MVFGGTPATAHDTSRTSGAEFFYPIPSRHKAHRRSVILATWMPAVTVASACFHAGSASKVASNSIVASARGCSSVFDHVIARARTDDDGNHLLSEYTILLRRDGAPVRFDGKRVLLGASDRVSAPLILRGLQRPAEHWMATASRRDAATSPRVLHGDSVRAPPHRLSVE
jgi:hypothetical protein